MSCSSCAVEVWTPRRNCLRVSSANQRSTWLMHDAEVDLRRESGELF